MKRKKRWLSSTWLIKFPALGKITTLELNNLDINTIIPFSIELAPSEQKIRTTLGLSIKILLRNLIILNIDNKSLIKKLGGGCEIWEVSNLIILKSLNIFESIKSSHDFAIPPKILFWIVGKAPTIKSFLMLVY